jgi:Flp pilus assembly protein TadB
MKSQNEKNREKEKRKSRICIIIISVLFCTICFVLWAGVNSQYGLNIVIANITDFFSYVWNEIKFHLDNFVTFLFAR